jgi:hypothetical protein
MTTLRTFAWTIAFAVGALVLSSGAYAQSPLGAPLFTVLSGGNECDGVAPPAGPVCRKGSRQAIGSATILFPTPTSVCFAIIVENLPSAATAAHIHSGVAGVNGAIVVVLAPPSGNPGASSGCVSPVGAATVAAIRADPTSFYVNVHNGTHPNGALRGQLH